MVNIEEIIDNEFRGCISIKKQGETLFERAYGYSDLYNQVPNTMDTRFATASAGKVFVAAAILQLVEQGRIALESTIGSILEFSLHNIDPDVTVEQLLTHTSGIPDYFDEEIMDDYADLWRDFPNYRIRKSSDLLPLFITKPMMFSKGEKFFYNNAGFVMLGLVIEAVTKKPFDQYLKECIFDPVGMDRTGYYELDRLPEKCASNYIYDEEKCEYYTNIFSVDAKGTGAGGAFTTIGDVEKFWNGLLSYQLLSPEMTQKMLKPYSKNTSEDDYGYGIWLKNETLPYFTGKDPGVSFISAYELEKGILVTIVSNFEDNVWKMLRKIREELEF
mgnify:CR=1 FL=1